VIDWKFRADGAEKWIDPMGRAKDEDSAQLNMARILMEQTTGKDLSSMEMYVWVMSGQTVRTTVPYMSEEQLGAIRPGGGQYMIREIFGFLHNSMLKWKAVPDPQMKIVEVTDELLGDHTRALRAIIGELPMVGEHMYQSKRTPSINMCTRYCEVQDECYSIQGGI